MDDLSSWYEDCYTDSDGYEYCDSYWVDDECYADLYLSWNVSGVEYSGWAFTPSIITPYMLGVHGTTLQDRGRHPHLLW